MQENRTKNSIVNICFSLGFQLVTLVLGFVNRTVFLQCLGVEYLGVSGLFSDILSMLSLADLGFGTAMTFSMYIQSLRDLYNSIKKSIVSLL